MAEIREKQVYQINLTTNRKGCAKKIKKRIRRRKRDCPLKYFAIKRSTLEACRRTVTLLIQLKIATGIIQSIKVLVIEKLNNNVYIRPVLAVVTEISVKNRGLAGS